MNCDPQAQLDALGRFLAYYIPHVGFVPTEKVADEVTVILRGVLPLLRYLDRYQRTANDLVRALNDAREGDFERLNEFGIRIRKVGPRIRPRKEEHD